MKSEKDIKPVEVFAGTAVQAAIVKSLLEDAGIEAFLQDEFSGVLYPWHNSPGGVAAVKVIVSSVDQEEAKRVVEEYESNLKQ